MKLRFAVCFVFAACLLGRPATAADNLKPMKFNEVREVAPGVFFRYSSISPTDMSIFGGSNNIWIVLEDYVVVVDANFPKEAADVIAAIRKTTTKPIRYVLDTHHHGDHAYGNAVFAKEGASIIAQAHCARLLRVNGPEEFAAAGKGPTGRKDIAASSLKPPTIVFEDKLVLDDGKQRVEFLHLGHSHTIGDAVAYLPKHKILCTGDACLNGPYNYMGHSDSASWIRCLEKMQQLDVKLVCPGHGALMDKELLEKQKRYFVELRQQVQKAIDAGKDIDETIKSIDMPWYKEWTTQSPAVDNIKHVYAELTGRIMAWDLVRDFGISENGSPEESVLRFHRPAEPAKGWTRPRRIVVSNLMPARLRELKLVAPEIEFVPVKTAEEAASAVEDADAVLGFSTPEIVKAGKKLRWIHIPHTGVEKEICSELIQSPIVMTNTKRLFGPQVADTALALLLALTRGLRQTLPLQGDGQWRTKELTGLGELHGKTLVVVGLGGIGTQVSRRAHGFGMRVMAVDVQDIAKPDFVFGLAKPDKLMELLPTADVVLVSCPLTDQTRGLIGKAQLGAMKKSAYLINVARGGVVQTSALTEAIEKKQIAGAGMDVTDPEPLPPEHPLWKMPGVVIVPHIGAQSPEGLDRAWRLMKENVRRFVAGEALLCVVDKAKGY